MEIRTRKPFSLLIYTQKTEYYTSFIGEWTFKEAIKEKKIPVTKRIKKYFSNLLGKIYFGSYEFKLNKFSFSHNQKKKNVQ